MIEDRMRLVRREVRSPPSAAIAGIVYSILMSTGMILTSSLALLNPEDITRDNMEVLAATAPFVLTMIPFAGIAFLWFTGVIRDLLGEREDRFFSTIFFGSGIIQVVLLFIWGAIFGTLMAAINRFTVQLADNNVYALFIALMNEIVGNFGLRMAGVYMLAIGTLWTRTKLMPRWLTTITYILALGFLLAAGKIREARFIFPVWVFVVSVYVLILNYRRIQEKENNLNASLEA